MVEHDREIPNQLGRTLLSEVQDLSLRGVDMKWGLSRPKLKVGDQRHQDRVWGATRRRDIKIEKLSLKIHLKLFSTCKKYKSPSPFDQCRSTGAFYQPTRKGVAFLWLIAPFKG